MYLCETKAKNGFARLRIGGNLADTPWDTLLLAHVGEVQTGQRAAKILSDAVRRPVRNIPEVGLSLVYVEEGGGAHRECCRIVYQGLLLSAIQSPPSDRGCFVSPERNVKGRRGPRNWVRIRPKPVGTEPLGRRGSLDGGFYPAACLPQSLTREQYLSSVH